MAWPEIVSLLLKIFVKWHDGCNAIIITMMMAMESQTKHSNTINAAIAVAAIQVPRILVRADWKCVSGWVTEC